MRCVALLAASLLAKDQPADFWEQLGGLCASLGCVAVVALSVVGYIWLGKKKEKPKVKRRAKRKQQADPGWEVVDNEDDE
jgi:hypothetical protein